MILGNQVYAVVLYTCYDGPTYDAIISLHKNQESAQRIVDDLKISRKADPDFVTAEVEVMEVQD